MKVFALVTDAFGSRGGIAQFNRDFFTAISEMSSVESVEILPRLVTETLDQLPAKIQQRSPSNSSKLYYAAVALKRYLANHFDVLICGHVNLLPLAVKLNEMRRVPLVLVVHGIEVWTPKTQPALLRNLAKVDCTISVSQFTAGKLCNWSGLDPARTRILPNTVDLSAFAPGPKRQDLLARYGLQGKRVLLTVAHLRGTERYKGVDEVLQALPTLLETDPDLAYLVVGDGTDRRRLERLAAQIGVANVVRFAGYIAAHEKADHYRSTDVFVMPGYGEGFGIVYLEALACGIPAIGSRADASQEVLAQVAMGFAVNPKNQQELVDAVRNALVLKHSQPDLSEFSQQAFKRRTADLMHEILARASQ